MSELLRCFQCNWRLELDKCREFQQLEHFYRVANYFKGPCYQVSHLNFFLQYLFLNLYYIYNQPEQQKTAHTVGVSYLMSQLSYGRCDVTLNIMKL